MILADTSVWINHLRERDTRLDSLVATVQLLIHPFVIGELALGSLSDRQNRLRFWSKLPMSEPQSHEHILALIERRRLFARGIGYSDANLLASTLAQPGTLLWTRDRRLGEIADELGVAAKLDH